jgi:hypothetical protein
VNRALLFNKLEQLGISSKMIRALRSLYNNVQSCIKLNSNLTDWFSVNTGSSCISPVMSIFFLKRNSSIPQNSLYVAGANVIPRYESGSLGSDFTCKINKITVYKGTMS